MKRKMVVMLAWMFLSGCALDYRQPIDVGVAIGAPLPMPVHSVGPPPWAPAYGYRAPLYEYYYYPDSGVYYSLATSTYFYMQRGGWQFGVTLPAGMMINPGTYVSLQLATDRPYLLYDEHRVAYRCWRRYSYGGHESCRSGGYEYRHEHEHGHEREHGHGHGHWR